ncbi:MAG: hypothetical protein NTV30_04955, partial [Chloroflexi bacterium]|nr:hypothetical protein [Chloroflexota bacterium]
MKNISILCIVVFYLLCYCIPLNGCSNKETSILTITNGDLIKVFNLKDIKALSAIEGKLYGIEADNTVTSPVNIKGVSIQTLCDITGGLNKGEAAIITGKDKKSVVYTYDMLSKNDFPTFDINTKTQISPSFLNAILVYEKNGIQLDSTGQGPLWTVVMGKENTATKTSFWNNGTFHIDITPISENWNLLLNGANKVDIDMKTFIAASAIECYGTSWKDAEGLVWEGIPLWRLVGSVDDSLAPGEDIFIDTNYNDNLADKGYTVRL